MATFQIKKAHKAAKAVPRIASQEEHSTNLKRQRRGLAGFVRQRREQRQRTKIAATNATSILTQDTTCLYDKNHNRCKRLDTTSSSQHSLRKSSLLSTFGAPQKHHHRFASHYFFKIDAVLIMLTMLFVITVVISSHAVFAAQRDSFKPKDPNSVSSSNVNALTNVVVSSSAGSSVGNGNSNSNGISNGNSNNNNNYNVGSMSTSAVSSSVSSGSSTTTLSTAISSSSAATTTTSTTKTTTTTMGSSSSSNSNSIASSSLQKVGSNPQSGSISGINRNTIELMDDNQRNGPYFDKAASKNVTALLGKTAYLNCRVKNLGNKTMLLQVSWVRHRDIHLLTVGRYTYTSDQRFRAIHQPQTEDWILQIKYPQHRDSGIYECQVSTTPHMSHYIHLNVVEPSTEIIGAPDLYIESGSTINLTCVILNSPEPPAYIFWNHNNAIINYDSPRGGVSVVTNKGETTTSFLLIKTARPSDSGHYQCNPSNAKSKSVTVHVLNGEFPAAMQRAAQTQHLMSARSYLFVYLFVYLCSLAYTKRCMLRPLRPPLAAPGTGVLNAF